MNYKTVSNLQEKKLYIFFKKKVFLYDRSNPRWHYPSGTYIHGRIVVRRYRYLRFQNFKKLILSLFLFSTFTMKWNARACVFVNEKIEWLLLRSVTSRMLLFSLTTNLPTSKGNFLLLNFLSFYMQTIMHII